MLDIMHRLMMIDQEIQEISLELRCSSRPAETVKRKTVEFHSPSLPRTVGDLTRKIEEEFEIPAFLVKLELNSATLRSEDSLKELRVRNGDTFVARYYSEAECVDIASCIEWLEQLLKWVVDWRDSNHSLALNFPQKEHLLYTLSFDLFLPWFDPLKIANKFYFISKNGLILIRSVVDIVLNVPPTEMPLRLFSMIELLLNCFWNMTEPGMDIIDHTIVQCGAVQSCTKALLQLPVYSSTSIEAITFNRKTIESSLGVLANLCEQPQIRLGIASDYAVVEQILSVALCPVFDESVVHSIVVILLELCYTPATHPYLLSHDRFMRFILMNQVYRDKETNPNILIIIRYYKSLICSILALFSPQIFTHQEKYLIAEKLTQFNANATPTELSAIENEWDTSWEIMAPYVGALYQFNESSLGLNNVCKETVLLALETMIVREYQRTVLARDGLIDYLLCLPWYVVQERVKNVVGIIQQAPDINHRPLSLLNMSKAAVAVYYRCGLDDVMRLSVPELAHKLWKMHHSLPQYFYD